jgi:hypothetical protein
MKGLSTDNPAHAASFGFEIGDLVREHSSFSEDMEWKPMGVIVGFVQVLGSFYAHVQILNDDDNTVIPLYLTEIRKI